MARQERAGRTRAAIIDAAAEEFDRRGFAGASLSDILKRAAVTKGALYFHFTSKEEIARTIIDEQFKVWQPLKDTSGLGLQTVIDMTHDLGGLLQRDTRVRAGIRLVVEHGTFNDPAPAAYQQWIAAVEECLVAARAKGDLRPGMVSLDVSTFIISSFTGVQISSQVLTERADIQRRITSMWEIVLPGLVPPRRLAKFRPEGSAATTTTATTTTATATSARATAAKAATAS
ncbi:ScbR family autoregulator-binding transcription factor [Couchioplanes azureus]|uniref:ScbR family autoregulator-binding transcription factor n=1 Tax=Couchioplanes caeruleus TaxID=56438 RepID=UPI0016709902|nr:ScbR family autoregulator-binding transcription factor [Couchioplanes caeruleus]GGQ76134.1 gamma-butyrolactone-binding protein [Couchioplanes caeruleus subsp. azureus]